MKPLFKILLVIFFSLTLSESKADTLLESINSAYLNINNSIFTTSNETKKSKTCTFRKKRS